MTRIKLCGLSRPCDIAYVNQAKPDFCGFIVDVPKSRRSVSPETLRALRAGLRPEIIPVGVFVNAPPEKIAALVQDGTISMVQLHGQEGPETINALRCLVSVPIIQAYGIGGPEDVARARDSTADHILLDHGGGGTGRRFDWSLLEGLDRPYILAGGLNPVNLPQAIRQLHPWGVDLSSGVETGGVKDLAKMLAAVAAARSC